MSDEQIITGVRIPDLKEHFIRFCINQYASLTDDVDKNLVFDQFHTWIDETEDFLHSKDRK